MINICKGRINFSPKSWIFILSSFFTDLMCHLDSAAVPLQNGNIFVPIKVMRAQMQRLPLKRTKSWNHSMSRLIYKLHPMLEVHVSRLTLRNSYRAFIIWILKLLFITFWWLLGLRGRFIISCRIPEWEDNENTAQSHLAILSIKVWRRGMEGQRTSKIMPFQTNLLVHSYNPSCIWFCVDKSQPRIYAVPVAARWSFHCPNAVRERRLMKLVRFPN